MTLGVRAVVLEPGGRVLLVRHTYVPGWYLPGGGVDRGESAEAAVQRELVEEAGVHCQVRPILHGVFRNGRRDHVVCYVVRQFTREPPAPSSEIAETAFFPLDDLPDGTTPATRARITEVSSELTGPETW
jgi:ADP-ribose pyrophosphatase YjhB (NUDIX family)